MIPCPASLQTILSPVVACRQERRLQRFENECEEQRVRQMKRQEKRAQATEDYLLKQRVQPLSLWCSVHVCKDCVVIANKCAYLLYGSKKCAICIKRT